MRSNRRAPWMIAILALLFLIPFFLACDTASPASTAPARLQVGECVIVRDLGEDDAQPVQRVSCLSPGVTPSTASELSIYRVAVALEVETPVMSRSAADELARLYCRGAEIVPGSSIYVFPTDESFSLGFRQFLCLVR